MDKSLEIFLLNSIGAVVDHLPYQFLTACYILAIFAVKVERWSLKDFVLRVTTAIQMEPTSTIHCRPTRPDDTEVTIQDIVKL